MSSWRWTSVFSMRVERSRCSSSFLSSVAKSNHEKTRTLFSWWVWRPVSPCSTLQRPLGVKRFCPSLCCGHRSQLDLSMRTAVKRKKERRWLQMTIEPLLLLPPERNSRSLRAPCTLTTGGLSVCSYIFHCVLWVYFPSWRKVPKHRLTLSHWWESSLQSPPIDWRHSLKIRQRGQMSDLLHIPSTPLLRIKDQDLVFHLRRRFKSGKIKIKIGEISN